MYKCALFDMDGTLVNTYRGIFNSYKYAFDKIGIEFQGEKFVGKVIGAPLLSVFRETIGLSEEKAVQAVEYYRNYYSEYGKKESQIYEGVKESLVSLKEQGYFLGVATLKREIFAKEILSDLGIIQYFDVVCGIDEKDQLTKADLLNKCLSELKVDKNDTILIGDSEYDAEGAEQVGIDFMAVTYGFGFKSNESLRGNRIKLIAESGAELTLALSNPQ